jgi:hypothetical protein
MPTPPKELEAIFRKIEGHKLLHATAKNSLGAENRPA